MMTLEQQLRAQRGRIARAVDRWHECHATDASTEERLYAAERMADELASVLYAIDNLTGETEQWRKLVATVRS